MKLSKLALAGLFVSFFLAGCNLLAPQATETQTQPASDDAMMEKEQTDDAMMEEDTMMEDDHGDDAMMEEEGTGGAMMEQDDAMETGQ